MPRYHGLDFLRAAMMLMGVLLHVGCMYMPIPNGANVEAILGDFKNPYRDVDGLSQTIQRVVFLIHYFRMPAFMLLAGFFAALVDQKRGSGSLLKNRLQRIVLPAVLFWFLLWPIDSLAWSFGERMMTDTDQSQSTLGHLIDSISLSHLPFLGDSTLHTMHLWFLYYLIMYYGVTFVGLGLIRKITPSVPAKVVQWRDRTLSSRGKYLILPSLMLASWATLRASPSWHFLAAFRFTPELHCFVNHYVFFLVGWFFYGADSVIPHLRKHAWTYLAFGFAMSCVLTWSAEGFFDLFMAGPLSEVETHQMGVFLGISQVIQAACVWLLIFALVGLSERYITKASPLCTYLVGASYWLYLIHRPLCTGFSICFDRFEIPSLMKASIVSFLVTAICLLTYHYLVSNSWIAVLLNGRRASDQRNTAPVQHDAGEGLPAAT
ncbi:MAG: acyltransferase family protein [Planctomycetota bacterium]|nr:acyltransferase family protein [Planctomycetota bacterium]